MKRSGNILIMLLLISAAAISQPDWVRKAITQADSFSVDQASAEITLFKTKEVTLDNNGHTSTDVRVVTKVLDPSEKAVGIVRELKTNTISIRNLKGWHVSGGVVEVLSDVDVAEFSITDTKGYYDESHVMIAHFPVISSGDIVAYEYTIYDDDWTGFHQRYIFQTQEPVLYSRFSIEVPDQWTIHKSEWNLGEIIFEKIDNRFIWTARNLPFRPEEPLMPPWSFLMRRVDVSAYNSVDKGTMNFSTWTKVA
ncbi:MAG TPA: DUF3857 domain-containing protein, partial [Bacteroidota bacterium]|nr:DUF3857 domain-containing protein [Bacteroidota bacterium]